MAAMSSENHVLDVPSAGRQPTAGVIPSSDGAPLSYDASRLGGMTDGHGAFGPCSRRVETNLALECAANPQPGAIRGRSGARCAVEPSRRRVCPAPMISD